MKKQSDRQLSGAVTKSLISFPNRQSAPPSVSDLSIERLFGVKASVHTARPKGSVLFAEGQEALGVYIQRDGQCKLSMGSDHGKSVIVALVGRGTVLGLPAALLGRPHAVTAEVVTSANVSFLSRADLLRHLRMSQKAAYAVAEIVSAMSYSILAGIKVIHLSRSADQKVARFLLQLHPLRKSPKGEFQVLLEMSQEEIGQMIGLCRETVARVLSRLKRRGILEITPPILLVRDRTALARLAEFPYEEGQISAKH